MGPPWFEEELGRTGKIGITYHDIFFQVWNNFNCCRTILTFSTQSSVHLQYMSVDCYSMRLAMTVVVLSHFLDALGFWHVHQESRGYISFPRSMVHNVQTAVWFYWVHVVYVLRWRQISILSTCCKYRFMLDLSLGFCVVFFTYFLLRPRNVFLKVIQENTKLPI